ncbi:glycoside hydrolase family 97 protein [Belliella sp. DSM 111904]|uniref:Glycoside hydrolase family 97 protein n=1 Tax=Belliella filtrata TaxID=2923435 RepID=A0ABS9UWE0_9BACT|nr:glycoside hydrolase family 97 protein [Belliella filtrata]MCH7408279.1 glycoside hydrolase family 97 protein [Belliella filtrata]
MKSSISVFITALLVVCTFACDQSHDHEHHTVGSPDKLTQVAFSIESGELFYEIYHKQEQILEPSRLGLVWENFDFSNNLQLTAVSEVSIVSDTYELVHGKQKSHHYQANERILTLENNEGKELQVVFSVSDNGVAFKYVLPDLGDSKVKMLEELTTYNFKTSAKTWIQPMADPKTGWEKTNPSYEESYEKGVAVGSPSPIASGWIYPALFQSDDTWVLISEAGLGADHAASRLAADSPNGEYRITYPSDQEKIFDGAVFPSATESWESPWRVLAIGSLEAIVHSTLGTDLAAPQRTDLDFTYVKPGAASWSWALGKDESIYYDIQKKHIDYASEMNWNYCLVDVNWDVNIGYEKIGELAQYAQSKGVGLILWYNSAGDWNSTPYTPKHQLLTREMRTAEFNKIRDLGVKGVKIDFFGGDGQSVMQYYHDILEDAAKSNLVVNFHGATLPRGWHRTYPNLVTVEAVKGFEMITFDQKFADEAPKHMAILPFTRNVYDPMDFTPMALHEIPNIIRRSSKGFELALSVLFYSGIQHYAESPEGMAKQSEEVKDFLRKLPNSWEETKFIEGFPGDYVVLARRNGSDWYISGINALETSQSIDIDLSKLGLSSSKGFLITDDESSESWRFEDLDESSNLSVEMNPNGGFVIHLTK